MNIIIYVSYVPSRYWYCSQSDTGQDAETPQDFFIGPISIWPSNTYLLVRIFFDQFCKVDQKAKKNLHYFDNSKM